MFALSTRAQGSARFQPAQRREHAGSLRYMENEIEAFIRFLAVERGLSENYQLSTERSLAEFAAWCAERKQISRPRDVGLPLISEYLAERKRGGLSASSIKLIVVALKIFSVSRPRAASSSATRRIRCCSRASSVICRRR